MGTPGHNVSGLEGYKPSTQYTYYTYTPSTQCTQEPEVSDFWRDYEGDPQKPRFSVMVYGDFSDFEASALGGSRRERAPPPSDPETLKVVLRDRVRLWSKDFVIALVSGFLLVLKNRGIGFRLWLESLRVWALSRFIAKHMRLFKDRATGLWMCNVVFLTLTYDPSKYTIPEAWRDLRRRFRRTRKYFSRHYGIRVALGVVEVHESLYPHLHMVILLERPAPVFYHKGLVRFSEKKTKWDRALAKEGFIDAVAPRNPREVSSYLSKYLGKVSSELRGTQEPEAILERPKALAPFLARLYRVPLVMVYPRGFDKRLLGLTKPPEPTPRPPEEILLAEAIWSLKYRKPIEGIPYGVLDYWARVERYIRELYAQYHKVMTGSEPPKRAYDLINISSIQSPPDWAFAQWLLSLLYSLFEATKKVVVLGYCSLSLGS